MTISSRCAVLCCAEQSCVLRLLFVFLCLLIHLPLFVVSLCLFLCFFADSFALPPFPIRAAARNWPDVAARLLQVAPELSNVENKAGKTAYTLARGQGNAKVMAVLKLQQTQQPTEPEVDKKEL